MTSLTLSVILLFIVCVTISEVDSKNHKEKIIIHVPYKIHKHHHTHTKYKVIQVPSKKEKTIIYYKPIDKEEHKKPEINVITLPHYQHQHHSEMEKKKEHKPTHLHHKIPEDAFLHNLKKHEKKIHSDFSHHFPRKHKAIILDSYSGESEGSHEIYIPKFSFKSVISSPKKIHLFEDSVAHGSGQVFKTTITPKPVKSPSDFLVGEVKDSLNSPSFHQHRFSNSLFKNPGFKSQAKHKHIIPSGGKYNFKKIKETVVESDEDPEYEHVGFLVIDDDSQKVLGKNFKNEFHSWR